MKGFYPVVFSLNKRRGFDVYVPDWEINIYGVDLPEAINMAREAICVMGCHRQNKNMAFPEATPLEEIVPASHGFLFLIDVDFDDLHQYDHRFIKKNMAIASWLNEMAEQKSLNYHRYYATDAQRNH